MVSRTGLTWLSLVVEDKFVDIRSEIVCCIAETVHAGTISVFHHPFAAWRLVLRPKYFGTHLDFHIDIQFDQHPLVVEIQGMHNKVVMHPQALGYMWDRWDSG